jgi:hypothetical protein
MRPGGIREARVGKGAAVLLGTAMKDCSRANVGLACGSPARAAAERKESSGARKIGSHA